MLIDPSRLLPFIAVAAVLVVTPGPDFAMTTRNVLRGGRSAGIFTGLGVAAGSLVWTLASVLGILALLRVSSVGFEIVRLAGSLYLIWLGSHSLFAAYRGRSTTDGSDGTGVAGETETERSSRGDLMSAGLALRQGFLCNILNPKAAVIFTSVLPQFVVAKDPAGLQLAALGGIFVLLIILWLSLYSAAADRFASALSGGLRRVVDAVAGVVLVGLGVRLALD